MTSIRPRYELRIVLLAASILLGLQAFPHSAHAKPRRVAVVCDGPSTLLVGRFQRSMEIALASGKSKVHVVGASELVAANVVSGELPDWPMPSSAARAQAAEQLKAAQNAYYANRLAEALDQLKSVDALVEEFPSDPDGIQVQAQLWRAAVHLGSGDKAEAAAAASAALRLRPDVEVDLSLFSPPVAELVKSLRARATTVALRLDHVPPGTQIRIDSGATVSDPLLRLPPGRHHLLLRAPGYRVVRGETSISENTRLTLPLPVAVPEAIAAAFPSDDESVRLDRAQRKSLEDFAQRLHVDAVVLGRIEDSTRFWIWRASQPAALQQSPELPSSDPKRVVAWLQTSLAQGAPVAAAPGLEISAQTILGLRAHAMEWDGCGPNCIRGLQTPGAGVQVEACGRRNRFEGIARVSWLRYTGELSFVNDAQGATVCAQSPCSADAGATLSASARAGYVLSESAAHRISVRAGIEFASHASDGLTDPSGPVGILPGYLRLAPHVGAAAQWNLGPLQLTVSGGAEPVALWWDHPSGALGSPAGSVAFDARMDAGWRLAGRWTLGANAWLRQQQLQYDGTGTSRLNPSPRNAVLTDRVTGLGLRISRGF